MPDRAPEGENKIFIKQKDLSCYFFFDWNRMVHLTQGESTKMHLGFRILKIQHAICSSFKFSVLS